MRASTSSSEAGGCLVCLSVVDLLSDKEVGGHPVALCRSASCKLEDGLDTRNRSPGVSRLLNKGQLNRRRGPLFKGFIQFLMLNCVETLRKTGSGNLYVN